MLKEVFPLKMLAAFADLNHKFFSEGYNGDGVGYAYNLAMSLDEAELVRQSEVVLRKHLDIALTRKIVDVRFRDYIKASALILEAHRHGVALYAETREVLEAYLALNYRGLLLPN